MAKKSVAFIMALCMTFCLTFPAEAAGLIGINVGYTQINVKTYYVDAENGSDSNSGRSEKEAWQTLEKVNSTEFAAGDSILLKADTVYNGQLWPKGSGKKYRGITLGMYGRGNRPVINGGGMQEPVVKLYNQEYWTIEDLEVTNDDNFDIDNEQRTGVSGIVVSGENAGELHDIAIRNCFVHDVDNMHSKTSRALGVIVSGTAKETWFNGITIENNFVEDCDRTGISTSSSWAEVHRWRWKLHENVLVRNNVVKDVAGDGMIIAGASAPLIEYNTAIHCCTKVEAANAGIWVYAADDSLMQFNEAYDTVPGGGDKEGFDIDHCTQRTTFQYNYSHNNGGGFLLICCVKDGINSGNIVRYNISQNDLADGFRINGRIDDTDIYNNTLYFSKERNVRNIGIFSWGEDWIGGTMRYYNNIFADEGTGMPIFYSETPLVKPTFENNLWLTSEKTEKLIPEDSKKIIGDPKFVRAGSGRAGIETVEGYKLQPDSPCIDTGMVIENNGGRDYFGNKLYNNKPDIGAAEYYVEEDKTPIDIGGHKYEKAMEFMNFLNIYKADSGKKFNPEAKVTRGGYITALLDAMGLRNHASTFKFGHYFEDADKDMNTAGYFDAARDFRVLDAKTTTAESEKIIDFKTAVSWALSTAIGDSGTQKSDDVIAQAKEMGLLENLEDISENTEVTRGITAQLLYNLTESDKKYYNINKLGLTAFSKEGVKCDNFDAGYGDVTLRAVDNAQTRSGRHAATCWKDEMGPFLNIREALNTKEGTDYFVNGYLKFDLSSLKSVKKATLRLYINGGKKGKLSLYEIENDNWAVDTITWDNAPKIVRRVLKGNPITDVQRYYDFDITELAQQEFAGDKTLSFMITGSDYDDIVLNVGTRACANYPQLVIEE